MLHINFYSRVVSMLRLWLLKLTGKLKKWAVMITNRTMQLHISHTEGWVVIIVLYQSTSLLKKNKKTLIRSTLSAQMQYFHTRWTHFLLSSNSLSNSLKKTKNLLGLWKWREHRNHKYWNIAAIWGFKLVFHLLPRKNLKVKSPFNGVCKHIGPNQK